MVRILPRKLFALSIWAVLNYRLNLVCEFVFFRIFSWLRYIAFGFHLKGFHVVHIQMVWLLSLKSILCIWDQNLWLFPEDNSLWRGNLILVLRESRLRRFNIILAHLFLSRWRDEGRLYIPRLQCRLCSRLSRQLGCCILHLLQALGLFIIISRVSHTFDCLQANVGLLDNDWVAARLGRIQLAVLLAGQMLGYRARQLSAVALHLQV